MEHLAYDIECRDFTSAGAASRDLKQHLKRIGAESDAVRRAMIAAYEAEMNVVIHAEGGGRLEAAVSDGQLDVDVIDEGPGIADVESAMREGWSTASSEARALGFGAGMGLPNILRNSDRLQRHVHGRRRHARQLLRGAAAGGHRPGGAALLARRRRRALQGVPPLPGRLPDGRDPRARRAPGRARPPLHRLHGLHRRLRAAGAHHDATRPARSAAATCSSSRRRCSPGSASTR